MPFPDHDEGAPELALSLPKGPSHPGTPGAQGINGLPGDVGPQGAPGPPGPAGTSPFTFTSYVTTRQLICSDINGCNYSNELVIAVPPDNTWLRVSLLYCITPQISTVYAVAYTPPYEETGMGCAYSGSLTRGQILTIGATMLAVQGDITGPIVDAP